MVVELQLPSVTPKDSSLVLKFAPGKVRDEDALIMELFCRTMRAPDIRTPKQIIERMNSAHLLLRETFALVTSEQIKAQMGPKEEI